MAGGKVALGVYLPDVLYDTEVLRNYEAAIRRKPDFLVWYAAWADGEFGSEQRKILRTLAAWGTVPVIAWDPMDHFGPPVDQPKYALATSSGATSMTSSPVGQRGWRRLARP